MLSMKVYIQLQLFLPVIYTRYNTLVTLAPLATLPFFVLPCYFDTPVLIRRPMWRLYINLDLIIIIRRPPYAFLIILSTFNLLLFPIDIICYYFIMGFHKKRSFDGNSETIQRY